MKNVLWRAVFLLFVLAALHLHAGKSLVKANDSSMDPKCQYAIPIVFAPNSFCDPDVEAQSVFDCREELMEIYRKQVKAAASKGAVNVADNRLWEKITELNSIFLTPCHEYFALVTSEDGSASWEPVQLQPKLAFTAEEYCEGPVVMMKLTFENSVSANPILYAGLPQKELQDSSYTPKGYFIPDQVAQTKDTIISTQTDSSGLKIVTTFEAPPHEQRIRRLVRYDRDEYIQYEGRVVRTVSRLSAVWKSGDTTVVFQDRMFGHHSTEDAFIGDPFFTDGNGDGLCDIIVKSSAGSLILGLQLPYGGIELRDIISRDGSGSGGC